jgi:hypothetical protein
MVLEGEGPRIRPADVGLFGQQLLKAVTTAGPNILAGMVNDLLANLHLPHAPTAYLDVHLPKVLQYQLDGVAQNVATGIVDLGEGEGTLLGALPGKWGKIDIPVAALARASTDLQFKKIMTPIRNWNYEGNLVLSHLLGLDIQNPAVRRAAADAANAATSYARPPVDVARAMAEKGGMLAPSMRRAQAAQIVQVAKVFLPGSSKAERLLGATAILSAAGSTLAIGKLLNDHIGLGTFEFDASKPGFGQITIPNPAGGPAQVIGMFPQEQVTLAIAQSVRELAEGDPKMAYTAWLKLFLGSSSPFLQMAEKAMGWGYEPGRGWALGDYGAESKTGGGRESSTSRPYRRSCSPPFAATTARRIRRSASPSTSSAPTTSPRTSTRSATACSKPIPSSA